MIPQVSPPLTQPHYPQPKYHRNVISKHKVQIQDEKGKTQVVTRDIWDIQPPLPAVQPNPPKQLNCCCKYLKTCGNNTVGCCATIPLHICLPIFLCTGLALASFGYLVVENAEKIERWLQSKI